MVYSKFTRRQFLSAAGTSAAVAGLAGVGLAYADPQSDSAQWLANPGQARLLGADDLPIASLPIQTRMRIVRTLDSGLMEVWVPRFSLYGRVAPGDVGPVPAPAQDELIGQTTVGPPLLDGVGMPGRVAGDANLRSWPAVRDDTAMRVAPNNAALRALDRVQGDAGDNWYFVNVLDPTADHTVATGFINSTLVRLPRLREQPVSPDRGDNRGRHFQADLQEPAMLAAFENGSPVWTTLTLIGTDAHQTPLGAHRILARVANETMTSERVVPPIPRNAPGGYYLENVLYTQYFTDDGASIHYNYWSTNWGYPGTHGCLGVGLDESKYAWDFGAIGTPVYIFE
jgi:hypothetical protein